MIRSFANLAVVPTPPPTYGCEKPATTSTSTNTIIRNSEANGQTFSYVEFNGVVGGDYAASPSGNSTTVLYMAVSGSSASDMHDIVFDHCVFKTCPSTYYGNGIHWWNSALNGATAYNITFSNCWFEPQPRMAFEWNGRGGWFHDITIDHCTFEAGGGQMVSFDCTPESAIHEPPWGVTVNGVVRGAEGLHVTNNLFMGTGVQVHPGLPLQYTMGIEFGETYAYTANPTIGRSEFSGNKIGRTRSSWVQFNRCGTQYFDFKNNLMDWSYNPAGNTNVMGGPMIQAAWSTSWPSVLNYVDFEGNTYILDGSGVANAPYRYWSDTLNSTGCTFKNEHWTKAAGSTGSPPNGCNFNFTNSTFEGCHFHVPHTVYFPASAHYNADCVFDNGVSGGTPT